MNIYLVRHGKIDLRPELDNTRPPGSPLGKLGRQQAFAAGEYLHRQLRASRAQIIHSPLCRTRQTAQIIAGCLEHCEMVCDDRVMEIQRDEKSAALVQRMRRFFDHAVRRRRETTIVVSHRAPIEALLCGLTGLPARPGALTGPLSPGGRYFMECGSIYRVALQPDHPPAIRRVLGRLDRIPA